MANINNNTEVSTKTPPVKKYGDVVITLDNVLLSEEKLSQTPSQIDGLDPEVETSLRILGCELIQTSGILLKLPQVAMASGQVLFHRFYYAKSMIRHPMETTAMACIALASKCEEAPRKIRDVISVFNHIKQVKNGKNIQPVILDGNYISLKNQVIKAERRLLKELGFCCHVKHPHKVVITYLRVLEADGNKKLTQSSWNYMNDALRTNVFLKYSPETIACACIWLSARQLRVPLPDNPPWYLIFQVRLDHIEEISAAILKLYTRKKGKLEVLEAKVEEIRKQQLEARIRSKNLASLATPRETTAFSPSSRANSPKTHASVPQKRSSSPSRNHGKRSGSPRSHSPERKRRRSASRSGSSSYNSGRSREGSRDPYKKKYSRSSSPALTPPPRFIKSKDKGFVVRSASRSPHHTYDKYDRIEKNRYDKYEKSRHYDKLDKRYDDRRDKYSAKHSDKKRDSKRESKRSYDNGYEKPHKSKKNGRDRDLIRRR